MAGYLLCWVSLAEQPSRAWPQSLGPSHGKHEKRLRAGRGKYRGEAGTPAFELTPAVLVNILFISQLLAVADHYLASGYQRAKALKSIKHVSRPDT